MFLTCFTWVAMFSSGLQAEVRDLSEISRGEGGKWKQREGQNFLRLRKGRGHEK